MGIFFILILLITLGFSVILHEIAHGAVADRLGDPTARLAGRLTLNPISHIDLFWTILLPIFLVVMHSPIIFASAKPVPYNPYNLRNPRSGSLFIGLAGPFTNIALAAFFGILYQVISMPFAAGIANEGIFLLLRFGVMINAILATFNLLPVPPLDGSKALFAIFPGIPSSVQRFLEQFGIIIVFLIVLAANSLILIPARFIFMAATGLPAQEFINTFVKVLGAF